MQFGPQQMSCTISLRGYRPCMSGGICWYPGRTSIRGFSWTQNSPRRGLCRQYASIRADLYARCRMAAPPLSILAGTAQEVEAHADPAVRREGAHVSQEHQDQAHHQPEPGAVASAQPRSRVSRQIPPPPPRAISAPACTCPPARPTSPTVGCIWTGRSSRATCRPAAGPRVAVSWSGIV
jgi:hypothetical protein